MKKSNIIAGLDIGSTSIYLVVGQKTPDGNNAMQVIGALSVPAEGINKGVVKSIDDVTSSISACLEKAERLIGVPLDNVWVSSNSPNIKCEKSKGVVAVSRSDGEITTDDVERAIEAAQALSVPANYEILHVIPVRYTVDNQEDIKDPIGMNGVRLEVETLIIQGLSSQIKNLTKSIFRTGLDINDVILSPLAAAEVVLGPKQKDIGSALINIGAYTTSMAVFEEGELLYTTVIPIGSEHITADIAIGLRCPINLAERIKKEHGSANPEKFTKKEEIDISDLAQDEDAHDEIKTISKKYLADIIEARVEEIFERVDNELRKIDRSGMLPAGAYLIGGGTKLKDIVDVGKRKLRLPVCLGTNKNIATIIDKVNETEFLNALGLVVWGNQMTGNISPKMKIKIPGTQSLNKGVKHAKKWFSSLLPR